MFLIMALTPRNAWAYLDPGSGSYLLQLLIAGLLAGGFAFKSFWKNLFGNIKKLFKGGGRKGP